MTEVLALSLGTDRTKAGGQILGKRPPYPQCFIARVDIGRECSVDL